MVDEEAPVALNMTATVEPEAAPSSAGKKAPRAKKASSQKVTDESPMATKTKTRGLSDEQKLEKIQQIEADVAGGATLKDAVKSAAISDQTYYQWKKAVALPPAQTSEGQVSPDDELAEFIQLEEENQRLRKLLSEKLRAENAELRKRLGLA